jgi:hypothetical protein
MASAQSTASSTATSLNMLPLEAASGLNCDYCLHTIKNSMGTAFLKIIPSIQSPSTELGCSFALLLDLFFFVVDFRFLPCRCKSQYLLG